MGKVFINKDKIVSGTIIEPYNGLTSDFKRVSMPHGWKIKIELEGGNVLCVDLESEEHCILLMKSLGLIRII